MADAGLTIVPRPALSVGRRRHRLLLRPADAGRHFGYVRVVGRRRAEAQLFDPLMTVPAEYTAEYTEKPLLRGPE
jgi:hypothetical protein